MASFTLFIILTIALTTLPSVSSYSKENVFFLSPAVQSPISTFGYFYGITGGDKFVYGTKFCEIIDTRPYQLSDQMYPIYTQSGAHDITKGYDYLNYPQGYSTTFITTLPHGVKLSIYINGFSMSNGTILVECLIKNNITNCLSNTDNEMISALQQNTDVKLDTGCFSGTQLGLTLGFGIPVAGIITILVTWGCFSWCDKRKNVEFIEA